MAQFELRGEANRMPGAERAAALTDPGFGRYYTDHMAVMDFTDGRGWHDARLVPTADFRLHPAAAVLHYGQEIFEGLKAYRRDDGSVWLFRPEKNAQRFMRSAARMEMAVLPEETFLAAVRELVELDHEWVPEGRGEQSLYIRPFMIADEPYLGVREAHRYLFSVIATPAGAYYAAPMKLWVTRDFTRAAPGGTGTAKCGGNYAASLQAANEAAKRGCGQVLYLDGAEHKWIDECGTMNFMLVTADGQLVTPALGNILDGITRDSILKLARDHCLEPVERPVAIEELWEGLESGHVTETFACGTAAVITPITGFLDDQRGDFTVGDGNPGPKTRALRAHLLDIQYGRAEDKHGWTHRVTPPTPRSADHEEEQP